SPISEQTVSFYLPLSPIAQRYPLEGLCAEHLSPLILTYYPPLEAVILSYRNVRLSEYPPTGTTLDSAEDTMPLAKSMDEYAVSFVWATVDMLLLKPRKGVYLDAAVNLQNESHLGLICWNLFGATIDRNHLPKDWKWREPDTRHERLNDLPNGDNWQGADEHGYFVDGSGDKVSGTISFRVRNFEALPAGDNDRGFFSIEGTLLNREEEREQEEMESESTASKQN
ncbi:hypothetical protein NA57DRAFT_11711, partial [Rhizodiscina lignyota]